MPTIQQKLQLVQAQQVKNLLHHIYDQTESRQSLSDSLESPIARIWELSVAREYDSWQEESSILKVMKPLILFKRMTYQTTRSLLMPIWSAIIVHSKATNIE